MFKFILAFLLTTNGAYADFSPGPDGAPAVFANGMTVSGDVTGVLHANVRGTEAGGTTILTSADHYYQHFDLSADRTVRLPPTIAAGSILIFENFTDFTLSFESSDTTAIFSNKTTTANTANGINPTFRIGRAELMALTAAPDTPAEWKVVSVDEGFYKDMDNEFTGGRVKFVRHDLEVRIWQDGEDPFTFASATSRITSAGFIPDRLQPNYFAAASYDWAGSNQEFSVSFGTGAIRLESSPASTQFAGAAGKPPGIFYILD